MTEPVQDSIAPDSGILQPVLRNRWLLDTNLPEELNQLLKVQAVRCSINLVKRTFHLEVEQPVGFANRMFYIMELLTKGATGISIQVAQNEPYDMLAIAATLVDHKYEQDYTDNSEVALHILDFEF